MADPENSADKNKDATAEHNNRESANIIKILDDLLSHTNSSRRMFLIFIASALFFGPAALVLGGVLLEHPQYNIRHLESQQGIAEDLQRNSGSHLAVVDKNGTIIRELPMQGLSGERPHLGSILAAMRVFIIISIIFAAILLWIALKEYRFFSHWSKKFSNYQKLNDNVDKELQD